MPMKTRAIILRNQISNAFRRLYSLPTPETVKASNHAKMVTGIPVAIANTTGRYKPGALLMVMGINIPKYNTPL